MSYQRSAGVEVKDEASNILRPGTRQFSAWSGQSHSSEGSVRWVWGNGGMLICKGKWRNIKESVPVPLRAPNIAHDVIRDRPRSKLWQPVTSLPGLLWQNRIQKYSQLGTSQESIHHILIQHVFLCMYIYGGVLWRHGLDFNWSASKWITVTTQRLRHWRMTHAYSSTEQGRPSQVNGQPRILLHLTFLHWSQTYTRDVRKNSEFENAKSSAHWRVSGQERRVATLQPLA
jgi:hypothetical protein